MTDVICRVCGEPWDCTGGLHFSHTDMQWWEFEAFIQGNGCPCCEGVRRIDHVLEDIPGLNAQWQRSLMAATDEIEPWSGFLQDPFQHVSKPWPTHEPRLIDVITREEAIVLGGFDERIVEERLDEPGRVTGLPVVELWVPVDEAYYSVSDDADLVLVSNAHVMRADLDREGIKWRERAFAIQVLVGCMIGPKLMVFEKAAKWVEDVERALADYPLLDDQDYSQREHDARLEMIEQDGRYLVKADAPGDWPGRVVDWLYRNDRGYGSDEGRPYVNETDLQAALSALGLLETEDEEA